MLDLSKINIIEGLWCDELYYRDILPQIHNADIPIVHEELISVLNLHNDNYWGSLRSIHKTDIAIIDYRHWYLSDDDFAEYVKHISLIKFPVVCFTVDPYGFERPKHIDINSFEKKLFERTKIITNQIKGKHQDTILLSPAITDINQHRQELLDYFYHFRNTFDIYNVHLNHNMTEESDARMRSFISEVLKVLLKEIWITRWSVPCTESSISTPFIIGETEWKPLSYAAARQRLRHYFVIMESLAKNKTKWFYSGMHQDRYNPRDPFTPLDFWKKNHDFHCESYEYSWNHSHFAGVIDDKRQIKTQLLDSVIDLAVSQNNIQ